MSGEARFRDLPEGTIFWLDGGLYEKSGEELAVHHATGAVIRFYGSDRVYPIADAAGKTNNGTQTDPEAAACTASLSF